MILSDTTNLSASSKQRSPFWQLPNELLIVILLNVQDDVDRYCLGLCCVRLFNICEEVWLNDYTRGFQRPRFLCIEGRVAWPAIPESCVHLLQSLLKRPSSLVLGSVPGFQQGDFESDILLLLERRHIPPLHVMRHLEMFPESSIEPDINPLVVMLRRLGEKVWARMTAENYDSLKAVFDLTGSIFSGSIPEIPEAHVLSQSLMFHVPTTFHSSSPTRSQATVLRNHTKKLFVLQEPMKSMFKECFDRDDLPNFTSLSFLGCLSQKTRIRTSVRRKTLGLEMK